MTVYRPKQFVTTDSLSDFQDPVIDHFLTPCVSYSKMFVFHVGPEQVISAWGHLSRSKVLE